MQICLKLLISFSELLQQCNLIFLHFLQSSIITLLTLKIFFYIQDFSLFYGWPNILEPFDMNFQLVLAALGPYTLDFTSSGRYMAVAGRKGHLALMDMKNLSLIKELQVRSPFIV